MQNGFFYIKKSPFIFNSVSRAVCLQVMQSQVSEFRLYVHDDGMDEFYRDLNGFRTSQSSHHDAGSQVS